MNTFSPIQTDPDDLDLIISRIVDGEASDAEWSRFRDVAARAPGAWEQLACWQQDSRLLCEAVGAEIAVADSRDAGLPRLSLSTRVRSAMSWGGWAAAAAVALTVWMGGMPPTTGGPETIEAGVTFMPPRTPEEALDKYIELGQSKGQVIRQLPDRVLVQSQQLQSGGYEVVFIRQIMEREVVRELYEVQGRVQDEQGRVLKVKVVPVAGPAELN